MTAALLDAARTCVRLAEAIEDRLRSERSTKLLVAARRFLAAVEVFAEGGHG